MNIDWPNLIVGALVGWTLGFSLDRLILWSRRIKVNFDKFEAVGTNFGQLYKMRFSLKGNEEPGECSCELTCGTYTTFAKWDETPNPLRDDQLGAFVPEKVPHTFHQSLYLGKEYALPILIRDNKKLYIFDGWWFGKDKGYYNMRPLNPNDKLKVTIRGRGFSWSKELSVDEIVVER